MKEIYIITKNRGKILAAQSIFSKFGISVKNIEKDYPEIQAETSLEVAKQMASEAAKEFGVPVLREDHSIGLLALGGMPGPFMAYFDKMVPIEQLLELFKSVNNREGYFELAAAYAKPGGEIKEYSYRVPFILSTEARGSRGNWNKAIVLKDRPGKTLGESQEEDNVDVWNKNYLAVAEEISKE